MKLKKIKVCAYYIINDAGQKKKIIEKPTNNVHRKVMILHLS